MILLRVLLLGALVWLIWAIWRQFARRDSVKSPERVENMVRCATCGQHVPEHMAVQVGGQHFCQEHKPDSEA